jgi:hypothetical protein
MTEYLHKVLVYCKWLILFLLLRFFTVEFLFEWMCMEMHITTKVSFTDFFFSGKFPQNSCLYPFHCSLIFSSILQPLLLYFHSLSLFSYIYHFTTSIMCHFVSFCLCAPTWAHSIWKMIDESMLMIVMIPPFRRGEMLRWELNTDNHMKILKKLFSHTLKSTFSVERNRG